MTKRESNTAKKLLDGFAERTEVIGLESGGVAVTAHWRSGGQKLFYTLDDVREHVEQIKSRS